MKKTVLFLYLILSINFLNAQIKNTQAQKTQQTQQTPKITIRFKVSGEKDTLVNLIKYFGKGLY